jgi:hypothetical protein
LVVDIITTTFIIITLLCAFLHAVLHPTVHPPHYSTHLLQSCFQVTVLCPMGMISHIISHGVCCIVVFFTIAAHFCC